MASDVVVVGVDGSRGSRAAVEHALEDADRRGARLHVIAAAPPDPTGTGRPPDLEALRAEARQQVDEVLAARPDLAERVEVAVEARRGVPGPVLIEASRQAALLVVGHRGRGPAASALVGSVGLHCVLRASCPVVVVRPAAASDRASA